jgi:hypothetical protein
MPQCRGELVYAPPGCVEKSSVRTQLRELPPPYTLRRGQTGLKP